MKLCCIIFDVDGTLVDNTDFIINQFKKTVKKFLKKNLTDEEVTDNFGPPERVIFSNMFPAEDKAKAWEYFLEIYKENHPNDSFFDDNDFQKIRRQVKYLGIFTGKGRDTLSITLDKLSLHGYFDIMYTGDDVERSKPFPEAILKILASLNLNKEETLFFGDSHLDILAGKSAGVKTAAASWVAYDPDNLKKSEPDFIFNTPSEFLEFVEKLEPYEKE